MLLEWAEPNRNTVSKHRGMKESLELVCKQIFVTKINTQSNVVCENPIVDT